MTIDADRPAPSSAPVDAAPPLTTYLTRMRRQRRIYIAALAVLAVLVVTLVQVVLRTGEISHATLHQATSAVAGPADSTTSANLTQAWHSDDATAAGVPFDEGTVVTYDRHTVYGRDYATGAVVWSYQRTDVSICTVFQETGTTVAIFTDRDGHCDEVDAFKTATGARSWYRTLDSNGNTITGAAAITASQYTIMIATSKYVQAVDPSGGIDRWTFISPTDCTVTSAVLGSSGVLIGQHCIDGDHLLLRDPYAGDDDKDKAKAKWRIESDAVPLSADQLISAIDPHSGNVIVYSDSDGKVTQTQTLTPSAASGPRTAVASEKSELITIGTTTYSLDATAGRQLWSASVTGQPTAQTNNPLVITAQGITELDATTGTASPTYAIAAPPTGSSAVRLGTGFVVAGSSTTVYR